MRASAADRVAEPARVLLHERYAQTLCRRCWGCTAAHRDRKLGCFHPAVALLVGLAGCSGTPQTSAGAIPPQANTYQSGAQPAYKVIEIPGAPARPGILASDGGGGEWFTECDKTIAKIVQVGRVNPMANAFGRPRLLGLWHSTATQEAITMTTLQIRLAHGAAVALLAGLAGCSASQQTSAGAIPPEANTYQSGAQPNTKVVVFRGAPANPSIVASDGAGGEWFAECESTIAKIDEKSHKYSQFTSSLAKTSCGGGVGLGRNGGGMWFTDPIDNKLGFIWLKSHNFNVYKIPTPNANPAAITAGPDNAMWFTEQGINGSGKIGRVNLSMHPYKITEYKLPYQGRPFGITPGSDGALWFTDLSNAGIGRITTGGRISFYSHSGYSMYGITAGPDGALWFTETFRSGNYIYGSIGRIDPYTHKFSDYSLGYPSNVYNISTRKSALWFTAESPIPNEPSHYTGFIGWFNSSTHQHGGPDVGENTQPDGIALGSDCRVWFTEYLTNSLGNVVLSGPC